MRHAWDRHPSANLIAEIHDVQDELIDTLVQLRIFEARVRKAAEQQHVEETDDER